VRGRVVCGTSHETSLTPQHTLHVGVSVDVRGPVRSDQVDVVVRAVDVSVVSLPGVGMHVDVVVGSPVSPTPLSSPTS